MLVGVETRAGVSGRVRMAVVPDFKHTTMVEFVKLHVAPGSTVYTDGLKGFEDVQAAGVRHIPRTQPVRSALRRGAPSVVPLADRAIGNLQQWLIGTYHGVSRRHLQVYLDEFVFRHNRRTTPMDRVSDPARARDRARANSRTSHPRRPRSAPIPDQELTTAYGVNLNQADKQKRLNQGIAWSARVVCPLQICCPRRVCASGWLWAIAHGY